MKIKKISLIFVLIICFFFFNFDVKSVNASGYTSEIIMEINSNRVLHEVNANDKKYMASTTKILTAITIIENCNISDIVTVTKETVGVEGSSIYLEVGEKLTVKDLLYGLMLRSGNDCAETLAVYCSKSIENFAELMNKTAKKIKAFDSNFTNPHGLHDENHYTTAYDLALISCYAMKNPIFREIVGTKKIEIPFSTRSYDRVLINKNKMLNEFDGSTGIKTGYTKKAGRCLVSSCVRDGMELVCVVLNCPPMFERSKTLLENTFSNYTNYKLVESDNIIGFTNYQGEKIPLVIKNDIVLPLNKEEKKKIKIVYDYIEELQKTQINNNDFGNVKIYCENNLIFQEKIYTIIDVK